ncbi:MAG: FAD-dependent oxidoreductase, partial [Pseudomonadota bacterium]
MTQEQVDSSTFDVVVVGSGAGGMVAALTASVAGLRVLLVEKTDFLGGTTSYSEAMIWAPLSAQSQAALRADSVGAALAYVSDVSGNRFDALRSGAYIRHAAQMLAFVEAHSDVRYRLATGSVDYYPDREGATAGTRSLSIESFDGRRLGKDFNLLRPPLSSTQIFGGLTIPGADLHHFYKVFRSARSTMRVAALLFAYAKDRLNGRSRSSQISGGDGLIGAILLALRGQGVVIATGTAATKLSIQNGRVEGVTIVSEGQETEVRATRGVILATGGFSADREKRAKYAPEAQRGDAYVGLTAPGATGDGLDMALATGAAINSDVDQPMAWAPVSWVDHLGSGFPHFMER